MLPEISSGWRPLERGAKQSFREPILISPPITPSDLQLVQLPLPKNQPIVDSHSTKSQIPFTPGFDRSSDRIQSGTTAGDSSLMVMNEKSHQGRMLQRSCFVTETQTFEVLCGSSGAESPIQVLALVPQGSKLCQRKACLAAVDHDNFLK